MAPVPAIHPELRALLAHLKHDGAKIASAIGKITTAIEVNTTLMSDVRDAVIKNTHALESLLEYMRTTKANPHG